jgi:hypothetical protein
MKQRSVSRDIWRAAAAAPPPSPDAAVPTEEQPARLEPEKVGVLANAKSMAREAGDRLSARLQGTPAYDAWKELRSGRFLAFGNAEKAFRSAVTPGARTAAPAPRPGFVHP